MEKFSKVDYKKARNYLVHCVLATDMSKRFSELGKFKTRVTAEDFDPRVGDKELTIHMLFHLADISNQTRPWEVCQKWTDLLFVEFFDQGDQERDRGSPISYLMVRCTINIAKSQIGFLDVIINPAF